MTTDTFQFLWNHWKEHQSQASQLRQGQGWLSPKNTSKHIYLTDVRFLHSSSSSWGGQRLQQLPWRASLCSSSCRPAAVAPRTQHRFSAWSDCQRFMQFSPLLFLALCLLTKLTQGLHVVVRCQLCCLVIPPRALKGDCPHVHLVAASSSCFARRKSLT